MARSLPLPAGPVPARAALVALALLAGGACSSGDAVAPTTEAAVPAGPSHGAPDDGLRSSMGARTVSVADIAALGPGPEVDDTWAVELGLNACGRFLEPPVASGEPDGAVSSDGSGTFAVAPKEAAQTGHAVTIESLADLIGLELGTGTVTFPSSTEPPSIPQGDQDVQLAGATLTTGQLCGETPAEVQLWIYTEAAANTGDDVRQVVTDPQDVPVVEDGMVFVIAFSPTSSLPTLPPSALFD